MTDDLFIRVQDQRGRALLELDKCHAEATKLRAQIDRLERELDEAALTIETLRQQGDAREFWRRQTGQTQQGGMCD